MSYYRYALDEIVPSRPQIVATASSRCQMLLGLGGFRRRRNSSPSLGQSKGNNDAASAASFNPKSPQDLNSFIPGYLASSTIGGADGSIPRAMKRVTFVLPGGRY